MSDSALLVDVYDEDFVWGTATSAFQIEGAAKSDGRGPSIWDDFCDRPGKVSNGDNGDIACDHYHRYEEDVKLIADMGMSAYRFSISWSRLLPDGRIGSLNSEGVEFYNQLIDCCLGHGLAPWVTLYHWDLPSALESELGGWLDQKTADLFSDYAELCFRLFGGRVKHWITLNEPWVVATLGYGEGVFAPGRVSVDEPYVVGHNLLLAHAKAARCYQLDYKQQQKGVIGLTNNCDWREPLTSSLADRAAAERALEFFLGWFADPVYFGDYPKVMRETLGERLPTFSSSEKEMLRGSSDFFGLNHYTTMYVSEPDGSAQVREVFGNGGQQVDLNVHLSADLTWPQTSMQWSVVPWGCLKLLKWIAERYPGVDVYITENGCAYDDVLESGVVDDVLRIEYYQAYIDACAQAVRGGVALKGYFAWSLLDNFEWAMGYSKRFGLHFVDFETGVRTPKNRAIWFKNLLNSFRSRKYSE